MVRRGAFDLYIRCRRPTTGWQIAVEYIPPTGMYWYDPRPPVSVKVIGGSGSQSVSGRWNARSDISGNLIYTPTRTVRERILQKIYDGGHALELSVRATRTRDLAGAIRNTVGWEVVFNVEGLNEAIRDAGPEGCPETLTS